MARKRHLRHLLYGLISVLLVGLILLLICIKVSGSSQSEDAESHEDAFTIGLNPDRDYLIVVNDNHEYVFGGDYDQALQPDLIYASDCYGIPTPIEHATNLAFGMLRSALHSQGFEVELYSAYRTKEDQEWVVDNYGHNDDWTSFNTVLPAGYSEHHTGLMVSFVIWWPDEKGQLDWREITSELWAANPEFRAVRNTLADYGFIERYPAGKEDITGVAFEPYEIRFVGSSAVAHEIMDNNLCLEEYLEGYLEFE